MALRSIPILKWHADGELTRLVAKLNRDDDYLVIDYDETRPGDCKWYLTWFSAESYPDGLTLQGDHDAEALRAYARTWVGDDE